MTWESGLRLGLILLCLHMIEEIPLKRKTTPAETVATVFFTVTAICLGWLIVLSTNGQKGRMLGHFPGFAGQKFSFLLRGDAPYPEGVYRRDSFNRYGDVVSDACGQNIMPGGSCRMQPRPRPENTGIV